MNKNKELKVIKVSKNYKKVIESNYLENNGLNEISKRTVRFAMPKERDYEDFSRSDASL